MWVLILEPSASANCRWMHCNSLAFTPITGVFKMPVGLSDIRGPGTELRIRQLEG